MVGLRPPTAQANVRPAKRRISGQDTSPSHFLRTPHSPRLTIDGPLILRNDNMGTKGKLGWGAATLGGAIALSSFGVWYDRDHARLARCRADPCSPGCVEHPFPLLCATRHQCASDPCAAGCTDPASRGACSAKLNAAADEGKKLRCSASPCDYDCGPAYSTFCRTDRCRRDPCHPECPFHPPFCR